MSELDETPENDAEYWLGQLASVDPYDRAHALQALAINPTRSGRLLDACEALLEDRTMSLLSLPYSFGEIRWCAADAVAALRGAFSIDQPVVLNNVFGPASTTKIVALGEAAGIATTGSGTEGVLVTLKRLAEVGQLPRQTITRAPKRESA